MTVQWKSEVCSLPALVRAVFSLVRPAGRTYLEVKVLYTPGKGKC